LFLTALLDRARRIGLAIGKTLVADSMDGSLKSPW